MKDFSDRKISYQKLYQDFLHPNPNINNQAKNRLKQEFNLEFMQSLLRNFTNEDVALRRKSILALGEYGEKSFKEVCNLYLDTENTIIKVSCLKSILKSIVSFDLKYVSEEVMLIVKLAANEDSPEIILTVVSLLKQLGEQGMPLLLEMSRDKDLLKAKASVSVLIEINEPSVDIFLQEILNDESTDPIIRESIFYR